jgi:TolB-like protein
MSDIFLSYSREDHATAQRFATALERAGFSVWWDQSLKPGEAFDQVTEQALDSAKAVVVLWSKTSVSSRWVRAEATQANANNRLVPVMIESCRRPIMFELTHTADLAAWKGNADDAAWQSFVESLRSFVGGAAPAPVAAQSEKAPRSAWFGGRGIAIVAIALLALAGVGWYLKAHHAGPAAGSRTGVTLAVLPFKDISPDHDQQTFVDGLTVEVRNSLTRLSGLVVIGRTSSDVYKNVDVDLRQIGRDLAVANIIEGEVRRVGDKVRVGVHLTNAATGATLWGDDFEQPMAELQLTPEVIARKVAELLQIRLGVGEIGGQPGMTRNPEAYVAYLEGLAENDAALDPGSLQRAMQKFEEAVRLDPDFAQAWGNLQNIYNFAQTYARDAASSEEWTRKADAAMATFKRLLPDDPMFGADPSSEAMFLTSSGSLEAARIAWERQLARDPLNEFDAAMLAMVCASTNRAAAANEVIQRINLRDQPNALLQMTGVMVAMAIGDRSALRAAVQLAAAQNYVGSDLLRVVLPLLDRPQQALAALRKHPVSGGEVISIALWMAWFGSPDDAVKLLRDHVDLINSARRIPLWALWYPVMADVRRLPEFKDLVSKLRLKDMQSDWTILDAWHRTKWGDFCKPTQGEDFECH